MIICILLMPLVCNRVIDLVEYADYFSNDLHTLPIKQYITPHCFDSMVSVHLFFELITQCS
jgi:hypothetical protein